MHHTAIFHDQNEPEFHSCMSASPVQLLRAKIFKVLDQELERGGGEGEETNRLSFLAAVSPEKDNF